MNFARSSAALKDLENLFAGGTVGVLADGDLLERFVAHRDEVAFEALVKRHGPMVVLCYLEGRTYKEVADRLRRPIGTVKVRLSRARDLLRGRLTRRGLGLPAGLTAIELGMESASAAVPAFLVRTAIETVTRFGTGRLATGATAQPAVELAVGLLRTMTMTKTLKVASLVLAFGVIASGAGVLVRAMPGDTTQKTATGDERKPEAERLKRELLGTWESVQPAGAPKTLRCVKHVTPTHWTWVLYDRDAKVALSTAGGAWTLKGDKYEETNEFSSEDMKHARGKAFAFSFKIEGDKWHVKAGPELEINVDEDWVRVK